MVNYWIFVSYPFSDYNRGSLNEIMHVIKKNGRWRIGLATHNRRKLFSNDKVLFYQAGPEGKIFVGSAELFSSVLIDKNGNYVEIGNIDIWANTIAIRQLIKRLSFIHNKKYYGLYLRHGIVSISKEDYIRIIKKKK